MGIKRRPFLLFERNEGDLTSPFALPLCLLLERWSVVAYLAELGLGGDF